MGAHATSPNQIPCIKVRMSGIQMALFPQLSEKSLPEGFAYRESVISPEEESRLIAEIASRHLRSFSFAGSRGSAGRSCSGGATISASIKPCRPIRYRNPFGTSAGRSRMSRVRTAGLEQVLVTEYAPGAPIGWHKDRPVFGNVMGLSLASPCTFRLRRFEGKSRWDRVSLRVDPRSAYLLSGPARWKWEHSIPPMDALRYSITFRNRPIG